MWSEGMMTRFALIDFMGGSVWEHLLLWLCNDDQLVFRYWIMNRDSKDNEGRNQTG